MKEAFCRFILAIVIAFRLMWSCKVLFVIAPLVIALSLDAMQDVSKLCKEQA